MAPAAKVLALRVRPLQVSHLCFEVDGILGETNPVQFQLGASVTAFDFKTFYGNLSQASAGDLSKLVYDSQGIQNDPKVTASALAALRAEPRKAALDKAINARQNAYYSKYDPVVAGDIILLANWFHNPALAFSNPNRIAALMNLAQIQSDQLSIAYNANGRNGVVETTSSELRGDTESLENSYATGQSSQLDQHNENAIAAAVDPTALLTPPSGGAPGGYYFTGSNPISESFQEGTSGGTSTNSQTTQSSGSATQVQTIVNTDYGYRMPSVEALAQNHRARISLNNQLLAEYMQWGNLPHLPQVFGNELQALDLDVKRLQVAYLNTILMSPIDGVVTGICKNLGDPVRAGEPVVRVEDNSNVILVATLSYPDLISIGSTVTVQTPLFDSTNPKTKAIGSVIAVRGHRYEDDQWDVLVSFNNIVNGKPVFPLNYHFDYDDTDVSIS